MARLKAYGTNVQTETVTDRMLRRRSNVATSVMLVIMSKLKRLQARLKAYGTNVQTETVTDRMLRRRSNVATSVMLVMLLLIENMATDLSRDSPLVN